MLLLRMLHLLRCLRLVLLCVLNWLLGHRRQVQLLLLHLLWRWWWL